MFQFNLKSSTLKFYASILRSKLQIDNNIISKFSKGIQIFDYFQIWSKHVGAAHGHLVEKLTIYIV